MQCPKCQADNEGDSLRCQSCDAELRPAGAAPSSDHESFVSRLMGSDEPEPPAPSSRAVWAGRGPAAPEGASARGLVRPVWPTVFGAQSTVFDDSLEKLNRFAKATFAVYVASAVLAGLTAAMAGVALLVLLLAGADWTGLAAGVVACAAGLTGLALLVYVPPSAQKIGAVHLAKVRAASASMDKTLDFWDAFLRTRAADNTLSREDVTAAAESLASVSRQVVTLMGMESPSEPQRETTTAKPGPQATEERSAPKAVASRF